MPPLHGVQDFSTSVSTICISFALLQTRTPSSIEAVPHLPLI
jgi:hypothetical protein